MAQYIDKSALVAEIERRRKEWWYGSSIEAKYKREECDDILSFLDTFEMKEMDLEKEYEEYVVDDPILNVFIQNDVMGMKVAKHFFELGMQVSNKAQKGEEV